MKICANVAERNDAVEVIVDWIDHPEIVKERESIPKKSSLDHIINVERFKNVDILSPILYNDAVQSANRLFYPNLVDGGFMQYKDFEIIDFHTHPFVNERNNICSHTAYCNMSMDRTKKIFDNLRVSHICGSVLTPRAYRDAYTNVWERILDENEIALKLRDYYQGFYIPGFHVHPDYVEESIEEIRRMHALGVNLIGELCPYFHGWKDYSCEGFSEILDEAEKYGMVVNCHSMGEDEMDKMVKAHPGVVFVAAHPGEYGEFIRHMERMKMSENYYLDLSGYGIFRHGMLRHAIDEFGPERFLFGSDYPTCNPAMYVGGVLLDDLITDEEKEMIFSKNAKRLLNLR